MKKITILLPDMREGGVEKMRLILAKEWRSQYDVEFLLLSKRGGLLELIPKDIRVTVLNITRYRRLLPSLTRYIRQEKPEVILAAMWPLTVVAALATKLSLQKTICVISEHGILSAQYQPKGKWHDLGLRGSMALSYRLSNEVVAVSKGVAKDIALLSSLPLESIKVIYNPASKIELNNFQAKSPFAVNDGLAIIAVGRFKKVKNHALLIKAFALVREKVTAKLYIVGDGDLRGEYEALIGSLNLQQDVVLTGFVNDPSAYYIHADLFVLSSDYEGFGNVIVEAMDAGTPIVATDCESGPREILEEGKYGTLVPVGDVNALADAMLESLEQEHDHEALKRHAATFSVAKISAQYLAVMFPNIA
ncbi:glycosyltransferase [Psychrobacter sp. 1U2]|uniref:glycosyltransferase n=1 Tax=Psychrobacter sp. 1U2 TaxID=3453577 RepID=UPI003F46C5A2